MKIKCHSTCLYYLILEAYLLISIFGPLGLCAGEKPVWMVVTRPMFAEVVGPLVRHRTQDGFETVVYTDNINTLSAKLKQPPAYILLVGDYEPSQEDADWCVSSTMCRMYRWRTWQRKTFASDMVWGDRDGDGTPEVPVGRLPVRTVKQAQALVAKIIAYENQPMQREDLRLPIWTGAPDFNPILDAMITQIGWQVGRTHAPAWMNMWVILASPGHELCGRPEDHAAQFSRQLQQGGVLSAMIGHGSDDHFFSLSHQSKYIVYNAVHARKYLAPDKQSSPLAIIACYCGNFAGKEPCIAESLLLQAGGPPAVIGATTESQPLSNYYSSKALLKQLNGGPKRLGDLWLQAQQQMLGMREFLLERLMRHVEGKLEDKLDIAKVKRDQMLMYSILGDPALRMRFPERLEAEIEKTNDGWHWRATKPTDAQRLYVEFREAVGGMTEKNPSADPANALQAFEKANSQLQFKTLKELDSDQAWEGLFKQSGTLRLVAEGKTKLYVRAWQL
jgi:peptidase C25-like protein